MWLDAIRKITLMANRLDSQGLYALADQADLILKLAAPLSETEREQLGTPNPSSQFDYIG